VFIHDALCELIICGDTEIAAPNLRIAINRLHKQAEGKVVSGFEHQFQVSLILQTLCQTDFWGPIFNMTDVILRVTWSGSALLSNYGRSMFMISW